MSIILLIRLLVGSQLLVHRRQPPDGTSAHGAQMPTLQLVLGNFGLSSTGLVNSTWSLLCHVLT